MARDKSVTKGGSRGAGEPIKPPQESWPDGLSDNQCAFLDAFLVLMDTGKAAKHAGVSRFTHYKWASNDPEYRKAFEMAKGVVVAWLEDLARGYATEGGNPGTDMTKWLLRHWGPKATYQPTLDVGDDGKARNLVHITFGKRGEAEPPV